MASVDHGEHDSSGPPRSDPASARGAMTPLRILLVEDDALIAQLLGDVLLDLGHAVCATARTESEAVDAAMRHAPDLMIVDVRLAKGDGIAVVRRVHLTRRMPYLFMTGGDPAALPAAATILRKPFGTEDLIRGLASALDRARAVHVESRRDA